MAGENHEAALEIIDRIIALQKEQNLTLPEEFHFKYAQVAFSAGLAPAAIAAVNQYLAPEGKGDKFYKGAIEFWDEAEQM